MHYIEIRYDTLHLFVYWVITIWHNFKVKKQKFVIYEVLCYLT